MYYFHLKVFHSDDPLDSKDFNPVDYINSIFPTEQVSWSKLAYKQFKYIKLIDLDEKVCWKEY